MATLSATLGYVAGRTASVCFINNIIRNIAKTEQGTAAGIA